MRILITNYYLDNYAGSERYTSDLAKLLTKKGHFVCIYSPNLGKIATDLRKLKIIVTNSLVNCSKYSFDVIHAHHNITAISVRSVFPNTPMIFVSHGILPVLEQPPSINLGIAHFIAISEEVRDNLNINHQIKLKNITVIRNFVDIEKFSCTHQINENLKNLLVLSNHYTDSIKAVIEQACEKRNINVLHVGRPDNEVKDVHYWINKADLVVTLGKGALESSSCGREVMIYDIHGSDGILTPDVFLRSQECNLSGRKFGKKLTPNDFGGIIDTYNPSNAKELSDLIRSERNQNNYYKQLFAVYQNNRFQRKGLLKRKGYLIQELSFLETELSKRNSLLNNVQSEVCKLRLQMKGDDSCIQEKNKQINEKDQQIKQKDQQIKQKDQQIKQKDQQIKQKDQQIKQKDQQIKQKDQQIKQKDQQIKQKDQQIATMETLKFLRIRHIYMHCMNGMRQGLHNPTLIIVFVRKRIAKLFNMTTNRNSDHVKILLGEEKKIDDAFDEATTIINEGSTVIDKDKKEEIKDLEVPMIPLDLSRNEISQHSSVVNNQNTDPIASITWFIPSIKHILFGGIYTILRFADFFQKKGIKTSIVVFGGTERNFSKIKNVVSDNFRYLNEDDFILFRGDIKDIPESDATVATLWSSCFISAKFNKAKKKFYFIQDYEPLFFTAGSERFNLSELTYRLNFRGIINTPGLAKYIEREHGMINYEYFCPAVDHDIYHISNDEINQKIKNNKLRIVFYGRPDKDRNAFDTGIKVLLKIKERYNDKIEITSVGAKWNEKEYGVEGKIKNLGRLSSLQEVSKLYRESDIGLVFMFSKHPSYQPFEYMASGCAVVTNYNSDNLWFLKDGTNCLLFEPTITYIFDTISNLIDDSQLRQKIILNGLESVNKVEWNEQCEKIFNYINK